MTNHQECKHEWIVTFYGSYGDKSCKKCGITVDWDWRKDD